MSELTVLLKALDMSMFEMGEAFGGLGDVDVWRRVHPRLLSVGELAAHCAYWEARSFMPATFSSSLVDEIARYYTVSVDEPMVLKMGAAEVLEEVQRIHESCKAAILQVNPAGTDLSPFRDGWTWEFTLMYQAFHFGYHTGQMYSVRHLMGHETVDN